MSRRGGHLTGSHLTGGQRGGILIEALVATLILAVAAAALYPGVVYMLRTGRSDANQAEALTILESAGNVLAAQPFDNGGGYQLLCGQAAPGLACLDLPAGFQLGLAVELEAVPGLTGLQEATLTVTGPEGVEEQLTLYKWDR